MLLKIEETDESVDGEWVCNIQNGFEPNITVKLQLNILGEKTNLKHCLKWTKPSLAHRNSIRAIKFDL